MAEDIEQQLIRYLRAAHSMEKQAAKLLEKGAKIAGDNEIAAIYRAHLLQTHEHERYIAERLDAHGATPSKAQDVALQAGALAIGAIAHAAPDTPVKLASGPTIRTPSPWSIGSSSRRRPLPSSSLGRSPERWRSPWERRHTAR
jgi:hypothetical protein